MSFPSKQALIAASPLLWILENKFVNENQRTIEFDNHRFLIDIYADRHPDIVCIKSAQVGFSVFAILSSFHELRYERRNILYALPTRNVVQDFVVPKVNPLITSNPAIAADIGSDSVSLKKVGDRFIYFKGGSEREAISVSADTLVIDEYDRMPDMNVVTMFDSRLQATLDPRRRRFSNPSSLGHGVDALWNNSNRMHWFITCSWCNHEWFIDLNPADDHRHFIDSSDRVFRCGNPKCGKEITTRDRIRGRWVEEVPNEKRRGYWMSQMIAPWVTAGRILEQQDEMDVATFHNMVLGKAYTPADLRLGRNSILNACKPAKLMPRGMVMGSDIGKPHWYWLGNSSGVVRLGKADSWDDLERIFLENQCEAWVMDAQPEFTQVQKMLRKYPGKAYACYFVEDLKEVGIIRWQTGDKRGIVQADRTKIIDRVVTEIVNTDLLFRTQSDDLEPLIDHAANMYRMVETDEKGKVVSRWLTVPGKPDHLIFAGVYFRIALEKSFSPGGGVIDASGDKPRPGLTTKNGKVHVEFDVKRSFEEARK